MTEKSRKKKCGRPKKEFDFEALRKLAALQCTDEELADFFDVSTKTIERRRKHDEEFCLVLRKGKSQGRISLRRAQMRTAEKGNATMQIWLGKQILGQRDKHEVKAEIVEGVSREELIKGAAEELKREGWKVEPPK